jgi:hypothetical protein
MAVVLERLPERPPDWDARIQQYPGKTIFHESGWLDHIQDIHPSASIEIHDIRRDGQSIGYFPGVRLRKWLLTIMGSPLPGTGTNYLGPLLKEREDLPEVIAAVVRHCRRTWVGHLELSHPWIDDLNAQELGLEGHHNFTHLVPLPPDESVAWGALKSTCRNRARKAQKAGLVCEVTDDPSVVEHFYEQYVEVYAKQGLVLPFGPERGRSLYQRLMPTGRLLPMWVRQGETVMAAGLFPFDQHAIYFWGAASWMKHQHLCPNELLHWSVIKEAIARGIPLYNMCGGQSQFKDKFGGQDVPYIRYSRGFIPGLSLARRAYFWLHWTRLKARGLLRPTVRRPAAAGSNEEAAEAGEG